MAKAGANPMSCGSRAWGPTPPPGHWAMPSGGGGTTGQNDGGGTVVSAEELPAVIWVVFGCGASAANCSAEVSPRMPSS